MRARAGVGGTARGVAAALIAAGLSAAVSLSGASVAGAAPGGLDPTFGSGGVATDGLASAGTAVAVLPSGNIVAAGVGTNGFFQVDGFSSSGGLLWRVQPFQGEALAVTVMPNGNVAAAGWENTLGCTHGAVVDELTPSGGAVAGFPTSIDCPETSSFQGVTVDGAGNIVAAGGAIDQSQGNAPATLVARVLPGGGPDPTFGSGGFTESLLGTTAAQSNAVAIASGNILTAGWSGASQNLTLAEFGPTGTLAGGFGSGGVVTLGYSKSAANGLTVLPGGNIVAVGTVAAAGGSNFLQAQWGPTGTADGSFGSGGVLVHSPALSSSETLNAVTYEPVGNFLIAAGQAGSSMVVAEYSATSGALNGSFGSGGAVLRSFPAPQVGLLNGVAVQSDGRAVAAGNLPTTGNATELSVLRIDGPSVSVSVPAITQVTSFGVQPINFTVSLDEPLSTGATAVVCGSAGANVAGQGICAAIFFPAGLTAQIVQVFIDVTWPVGHAQSVGLAAQPSSGLGPSHTQAVAFTSVQHVPGPHPYTGYWLVASDGGVFRFGTAPFHGSTGGLPLFRPVVGMAALPNGNGYWLVASDGGIFAFGAATFHGSTGGIRLTRPIVGMAATPDGNGYWLVASDGGIFAFGDARYFGSTGGIRLTQPIVGMAATPDGAGYWLVARDGGVFSFGDAAFFGSTGGIRLAQPIVGIAAYPGAGGYWLVASDGGIFSFGAAPFLGSTGGIRLSRPIVGIDPTYNGQGYYLVASDGGIFAFGNAGFFGSTGGIRLARPIVGMTG